MPEKFHSRKGSQWLDRRLTAGLLWQIVYLVSLLLLLVVFGGLLAHWHGFKPAEAPWKAFWWSFSRAMDPGNLESDYGNPLLMIISSIVSMGGLFLMAGLLVATLVNAFEVRARLARQGAMRYSRIRNYGMILGWDMTGPAAVGHLLGTPSATVVIISLTPAEVIREAIRASLLGRHGEKTLRDIVVYHGSIDAENELKCLDLAQCRECIILGDPDVRGSDSRDIEVTLRVAKLLRNSGRIDPLPCYVHIANLRIYDMLQELDLPEDDAALISLRMFNFYENWARRLWSIIPDDGLARHYFPLAHQRIGKDNKTHVHLVVAGFDSMGQALAIQAARVAHYANGCKTKITVMDPDAPLDTFLSHSLMDRLHHDVEFTLLEHSIDSRVGRRMLEEIVADENAVATLAICMPDPDEAMAATLALPSAVYEAGIPLLVRQETRYGISALAERISNKPKWSKIRAFGMVEQCYNFDPRHDALAEALHDRYLEQAKEGGFYDADKPKFRPWKRLPECYRWSNRFQADAVMERFASVGYELVPCGKEPVAFTFPKEVLERLAEMEHDRWWAERVMKGWVLGGRNDEKKIHPDLVPFNELDLKTQDYDRAFVQAIPHLLACSYHIQLR